MIISIPDLLSTAVLTEVRQIAAAANYQDGKLTAGQIARGVKQNLQTVTGDATITRAQELITTALLQNEGGTAACHAQTHFAATIQPL